MEDFQEKYGGALKTQDIRSDPRKVSTKPGTLDVFHWSKTFHSKLFSKEIQKEFVVFFKIKLHARNMKNTTVLKKN